MRLPCLILLITLPHGLPAIADESAAFRQGEDALAMGLWEIAAIRFDKLLSDSTLPGAQKSRVAMRLAEAWIHGGKPADALALLGQSFATKDPEAYFWKGQALAASGRFNDSLVAFAPALEDHQLPYRTEAILSRASLQLALNQADAARQTLDALANDSDPAAAAKARLRQAEILLDQGNAGAARAAMPAPAALSPADRNQAALLEAHLLLAEGKPDAAIQAFTAFLEQPRGKPLASHRAATIGLADALAAQGSAASAAKTLLDFLQDHPEAPGLDLIFGRLLQWLPDSPTPTDPTLEQLAQWIPPPPPPASSAINTRSATASAAWPVVIPPSDLAAHALYARAIGLHRLNTPDANAEARRLLTRLRLEYPAHLLATRALLQTGRWLLDQGNTAQALAALTAARDAAKPADIRGEAAFLSGRAAFAEGDTKQAIQLFDEANKALTARAADAARINATIARLQQGEVITITATESSEMAPGTLADLELEQALAATPPSTAKSALEAFLDHHPDHPRCADARLATADAALSLTPPDLAAARAQLDALAASQAAIDALPAARLALVRLRLTDLSNQPKATIAAARAFLESFPDDPAAAEAALVLGRNLFQAGDYNPARMTLQKLAAEDANSTRAQAAWLLAARAAALIPSPQSREEALGLFDHAIAIKGPLAPIANLEKARLLIDLNHLPEACTLLRAWSDSLPKDDALRLPAGFLLGEALTAQAEKKPAVLTDVLALYQKLLSHPKVSPATRHRLQFLRGQTLEQLPNPKDPGVKRVAEALEAYYSVLETASTEPPAEWEWFERCGFRALEIYEAAQRWQPAIAIAKKIASFKGPRAEEAAARARSLQLKHMVWEDE